LAQSLAADRTGAVAIGQAQGTVPTTSMFVQTCGARHWMGASPIRPYSSADPIPTAPLGVSPTMILLANPSLLPAAANSL